MENVGLRSAQMEIPRYYLEKYSFSDLSIQQVVDLYAVMNPKPVKVKIPQNVDIEINNAFNFGRRIADYMSDEVITTEQALAMTRSVWDGLKEERPAFQKVFEVYELQQYSGIWKRKALKSADEVGLGHDYREAMEERAKCLLGTCLVMGRKPESFVRNAAISLYLAGQPELSEKVLSATEGYQEPSFSNS